VVRYWQPALVIAVAILLFPAPMLIPMGFLGQAALWLSPCLYLGGTAWWARRAASGEPLLWPHLLLVWAPALPPLIAMKTANSDDGEFTYGVFSAVVLFICFAAAAVILVRRVPVRPARWGED